MGCATSAFAELGSIQSVQIAWIVEATVPPRFGNCLAGTAADQLPDFLQAPLT